MSDNNEKMEEAIPLNVNGNDDHIIIDPIKDDAIKKEIFVGLTKEELKEFENDPFWKKIRLAFIIIFWLAWILMLAAAIVIVVLTPKCPKRPKLDFWQKKTNYWVDVFAFSDSNKDGIGDIKGLQSKLDYINKDVGAGVLILDAMCKGQFSSGNEYIGFTEDFMKLDSKVGSIDDFKRLAKDARKKGIEVILTLNFNHVSVNHKWVKENKDYFIKKTSGPADNWKARNGENSWKNNMYTVAAQAHGNELSRDLNLKDTNVIKELKKVVEFWLKQGASGILLTDVGLYVENFNTTIPYTEGKTISTGNNKDWYAKVSKGGQIFSKDTLDFISEIRKVVDQVQTDTDKPRVLMLHAGNVGFGLDDKVDPMLHYLGKANVTGAHAFVSQSFVFQRGWKAKPTDKKLMDNSAKKHMDRTPMEQALRVALATGTASDWRNTDIMSAAETYLLPGPTIIYYGTELGLQYQQGKMGSTNFSVYPMDKRMPFYDYAGVENIQYNHLMMPWDTTGKQFSEQNQTLSKEYPKTNANVDENIAIGTVNTVLSLHKKLNHLVKTGSSIIWGNVTFLGTPIVTGNKHEEVFCRFAKGFPKIIAILLKNVEKVYSFSDQCKKATLKIVFPEGGNLKEGKSIDMNKVYLGKLNKSYVYVFECDTK